MTLRSCIVLLECGAASRGCDKTQLVSGHPPQRPLMTDLRCTTARNCRDYYGGRCEQAAELQGLYDV